MLSVSSKFTAAEKADVNQVASKIQLVLGNYASASAYGATASASSSDGSGDYPAAGAIDGDRTELNVGPASGADNDVGQSSWRSSVKPSITPQTLTIDFGASRTINRIKLYQLSSHGLKSYKLESSPDNSAWTLIDKTTDQGGGIETVGELDTVDFDDVTCQYVRLTVSDTQVASDYANVVEIECYRKVDVTDRIVSAKVNRQRDYKLQNPLAATFSILCDNSDRFFSPSHVPSSDESDAGFVNSELKPNIGVIIEYGFAYGGDTPELANVLSGYVDRLSVDVANRQVTIDGRDFMKQLINQIASSKLKTSQDIADCIQYALNLANFSNWEMSLDATSVTIDDFFIENSSLLTVIRDLVQAAADAAFYFDENGIARFRYFVDVTPQSHTDSSESDFESGTVKTNLDTTSQPGQIGRKWFLIDDFSDGQYLSNPAWTVRGSGTESHTDSSEADFEAGTVLTNIDTAGTPGQISRKWFLVDDFTDGDFASNPTWSRYVDASSFSISSNQLKCHIAGLIATPFTPSFGTWRARIKIDSTGDGKGIIDFVFMSSLVDTDLRFHKALCIRVDSVSNLVSLISKNGATSGPSYGTVVHSASYSPGNTYHSYRATVDASNNVFIYVDESLLFTVNASAYTFSAGVLGFDVGPVDNFGLTNADYFVDDIYYATNQDGTGAPSTSQAVFESQVIDQTANVTAEGLFQADYVAPSGTTIQWFTATSDDALTWDAYVAATPGSAIASTARRYLKWKAVLTCVIDDGNHNANITAPSIQDVTLNWTVNSWAVVSQALKYAPGTSGQVGQIDMVLSPVTGTWRANIKMSVGSASGEIARMYIVTTGYDATAKTYLSGYYLELDQAAGKVRLCKIDAGGTRTTLVEVSKTITSGTTYSVRVSRSAFGAIELYWNESSQGSAIDTDFSTGSVLALEVDPNSESNGSSAFDDIHYSPTIDGTIAISDLETVFESQVVDMTASLTALGIFEATTTVPTGCAINFYTATSDDGVTFDAYASTSPSAAIRSSVKRYLKWKAVIVCLIDDGSHNANLTTPYIFDVTINWFTGAGTSKYPSSVSFVFKDEDVLLVLQQEYADNLGGDSAILNDVDVQAQPLVRSGNDSDVKWQGTVGTPPVAIDGSNPLSVTDGDILTYPLVINGGMDTSRMSGASPAAVSIAFAGGGAGTYKFTTIHPTRPVLQITITGTGTITALQVQGKAFSNNNTIALQNAQDAASIRFYGDRKQSISNKYVVNSSMAATIASKLVANSKDPVSYIPQATVRPTFSAQLNDRVTVIENNSDIDADYVIAGISHTISAGQSGSEVAQTDLLLLKVV